ncbi:MAG: type II toxin-antitoxin system VapC family toxin [Caldilineaceae bacterium SB0665_bin_21]|nr:type II toxin-antitoxin system VapC family toxin [Caldilineaceae bacterium SB0665_bin_21]MYA03843.1 type II toxin-antitoxin system VapC family toxin [Caldilineaceae bacterium SB0664_bin_22]MYC62546.1 type II toxin-antitoxin system VapC family toxin [Caldilineaceae bacterium SB0661_bin_34]
MRRVPHSQADTFLAEHNDLWLSTIVLHELDYGMRLLEQGWK